jgi:CRP/FNR family transcriptional regulator, cyclic AMP receptor protein
MMVLSTDESGRFLASPLLAGVDDEARSAVFRRLVKGRVSAGTPLLAQGKTNQKLWFVLEGSVAIERKQADGHLGLMATMSGPAILGTTTFFRSTAPTASIRATTDLTLWSLDHESFETLRRDDPRTAEALELAILRVLAERFELLDVKISKLMAEQGDDRSRANEWANFRSRLFEEPAL